jgi:ribosomal protein S18 acetylase RimI-like enzyme
VVQIRSGSAADAEAIAGIRIESWRAAYTGIIPAAILDHELGGYDAGRVRRAFVSRPWQRVLIAEQPPGHAVPGHAVPGPAVPGPAVPGPAVPGPAAAAPAARAPVPGPGSTAQPTVVGYAAFGPEQGLDGRPRTARGGPGPARSRAAELYALYVAPAYWSTGAGRALLSRVLAEAQAEGCPRIVLWVLEQNARARRFYERAGFRRRGRTHPLDWLGGVPEVCYVRDLGPAPG